MERKKVFATSSEYKGIFCLELLIFIHLKLATDNKVIAILLIITLIIVRVYIYSTKLSLLCYCKIVEVFCLSFLS